MMTALIFNVAKQKCLSAALVTFSILVFLVTWMVPPISASMEVRAKDIARFNSEDGIELLGYGLVVGLNGTGDGRSSTFTAQSMANMLKRMGITVDPSEFRTRNVAAVMVSAHLSPHDAVGSKVDCTVSSIGDAKSLQGGILLLTTLHGTDGVAYAVAQGPLSIGGYNYSRGESVSLRKNHSTTGIIPGGADIKANPPISGRRSGSLNITLFDPDFTTAEKLAEAINDKTGKNLAIALNEATVRVSLPDSIANTGGRVGFISLIENLRIEKDTRARVVINERTGTIAAGANVTVSAAAISHGNLHLEITNKKTVSQPGALSLRGKTVVSNDTNASVKEEEGTRFVYMPESTTVGDLADALNLVGVTPRDLISIFQALRKTGALNAELIIM
jgi:flagellar P-ring protein precursor FlgI